MFSEITPSQTTTAILQGNPSATKLRQGNVFTGVCQSFCSQCSQGGSVWQTPPWADIPRQTPPFRHPLPSACWDTPPGGHCSGRYASYWNAFLFSISVQFVSEDLQVKTEFIRLLKLEIEFVKMVKVTNHMTLWTLSLQKIELLSFSTIHILRNGSCLIITLVKIRTRFNFK